MQQTCSDAVSLRPSRHHLLGPTTSSSTLKSLNIAQEKHLEPDSSSRNGLHIRAARLFRHGNNGVAHNLGTNKDCAQQTQFPECRLKGITGGMHACFIVWHHIPQIS